MKVANEAIYRQIERWKFPVDRGRLKADPPRVLKT
jgi:hypothetical protein